MPPHLHIKNYSLEVYSIQLNERKEMSKDNYLNKYRKELQEFHTEFKDHETIHGYNAFSQAMSSHAKEYSQLIIKSLLSINGGALITLPAFLTVLDNISKGDILISAIFYSIGLVCVTVCALFAFFCVNNSMKGLGCHKQSSYIDIMQTYLVDFYTNDTVNSFKTDSELLKNNAKKHFDKTLQCENTAIVFGVLSLFSFILGSVFFIKNSLYAAFTPLRSLSRS